jgi:lysophospholipase L1-like esterase
MWENRPGLRSEHVVINRWGFRDIDYPTQDKPGDVVRIAFVGDSVTFGSLADDTLFVSLIGEQGRELRGDRHLETMNFSVAGYNALQMAELVRAKVLDFAPDGVVYVLCLNDFDFDDGSGQLIRYFRPPASFLWERLHRPRTEPSLPGYVRQYFARNHREVFSKIGEMKRMLKDRGAGLQVAVLPVFEPGLASFREYRLADVHQALDELLREGAVSYIDLLKYFRECSDLAPAAYADDVWHLNALGHRFVARALFDALRLMVASAATSPPDDVCTKLRDLRPAENLEEQHALRAALASGAPGRLAVDSSLVVLSGFWPLERSDRGAYAWSLGHGVVTVGGLFAGESYRVRLGIVDLGGRTRIELGPEHGALAATPTSAPIVEAPEPLVADAAGRIHLELHVPAWRPSDRGSSDTRDLGIALGSIEVRPVAR